MNRPEPIAVVGIGAIFPGASDPEQFWRNIVEKRDASREAPPGRWALDPAEAVSDQVRPDKVLTTRGCFVDPFTLDPRGLDLDPAVLGGLDPLFHMVLHAGRQAFEDARTDTLDRDRVGVILAAIALPTDGASAITRETVGRAFEDRMRASLRADTARLAFNPQSAIRNPQFNPLNAHPVAMPAGLLARALRLGGGHYTLDAACASSLYALKLACDELREGRADAMLAGGVSRPDCLYTQMGFSQLHALSPSGRCRPFDRRADGLLVGEGAGIVLLKRLGDARRDGDRVYGVIRGIGLSNDIGGSLLAPDSEGQLRAMRAAFDAAGWSPRDVDLVECHGTGTPLGDEVELQSLRAMWEGGSEIVGRVSRPDGSGPSGESVGSADPTYGCAIGSVKSNVGHLLTAAGAAGFIKVLLALAHRTLPPSANFEQASEASPLHGAPLRVQTDAAEWAARGDGVPRRAAVSAFGFGGINAHVLVEEAGAADDCGLRTTAEPAHIAIVGMSAHFGGIDSLRRFQEMIFRGESAIGPRPDERWRGCDALMNSALRADTGGLAGAYIEAVHVEVGRFKLPPNEIAEVLPQQLLMLQAAAAALADAGMPLRERRLRMGAVIGIGLDLDTTNFHLRWRMAAQARRWAEAWGLELSDAEMDRWVEALRKAVGPPLNATRTVGNLGGIVASRVARELGFGGPCFGVSSEETSGLTALEIAMRALGRGELDAALVGAVDFAGDLRIVAANAALRRYSASGCARPLDAEGDGALPGEGAAAVVVKRLEDALRDGDRVYAVLRGVGRAGGDDRGSESRCAAAQRAFADAGVPRDAVDYVEMHASGDAAQDGAEAAALATVFGSRARPCALGSVQANIGCAGAAAGLAGLVKAALCLFHEIIPPLPGYSRPVEALAGHAEAFHVPRDAAHWLRDRAGGPRRAAVSSVGLDGSCVHVVLEGVERAVEACAVERRQPLGGRDHALFTVSDDELAGLLNRLEEFEGYLRRLGDDAVGLERLARRWFDRNQHRRSGRLTAAFVAGSTAELSQAAAQAAASIRSSPSKRLDGRGGAFYSPEPLAASGGIAFVFPGSGSHCLGMGRELGVQWPEVLRGLDASSQRLAGQFMPRWWTPQRLDWGEGWEADAAARVLDDPLRAIFGQAAHGVFVSDLLRSLGVEPRAVIGYSLGESAGLMALRAWRGRDELLSRLEASPLFRSDLVGRCDAARQAWSVPDGRPVEWFACVLHCSAARVRKHLSERRRAYVLIVNTPDECVVGGLKADVLAVARKLNCEPIPLEGVPTVHCEAARPVEEAYRKLHSLPTTPPDGVRFYSAAWGRAYEVTRERAAASITDSALRGFDFPALVKQAYRDGVRLFVEVGPAASCTRMIGKILAGKPHFARSAWQRNEDETAGLLRLLAGLAAEGVSVDLAALYGVETRALGHAEPLEQAAVGRTIRVAVGGPAARAALPEAGSEFRVPRRTRQRRTGRVPGSVRSGEGEESGEELRNEELHPVELATVATRDASVMLTGLGEVAAEVVETAGAEARAHEAFLEFVESAQAGHGEALAFQSRLAQNQARTVGARATAHGVRQLVARANRADTAPLAGEARSAMLDRSSPPRALNRAKCLKFACGSIAAVLGPQFAEIDAHPTRVRLPDEPLMLVDRILDVQGEPRSLSGGSVVTEHDVLAGAWYLDGGRSPVCITVEAGQADLFLCAWLGIDFATRGERVYRLLDATVTFHRGLPRAGETIRYDIRIDKFVRQGNTWLFFFRFDGTIDGRPMLSMREGCAGFFTAEEIAGSGGIVLTGEAERKAVGEAMDRACRFVPMAVEAYDEAQVGALRRGDLAGCFGAEFAGLPLREPVRLPGGRMRLMDRVLSLDPDGGSAGLGLIRAEADIHPDDWFLTCHFVDDRVMPGTLMYECCAHTLRVLLMRMGWVGEQSEVAWEPVVGVPAKLKCRGPVTAETKKVVYEIEVKELGFGPEPFVIADALMYADGERIVQFRDMSMRMTGMTRERLQAMWSGRNVETSKRRNVEIDDSPHVPIGDAPIPVGTRPAIFDTDRILAFAVGEPSEAFGEPYRIFDGERRIARLPGPPYQFLDRITRIHDATAFVLKAGAWIEAQYDVPAQAWYFAANRQPSMPFSVILEIALQPCGWLAAYLGSALRSPTDLSFRNLGGTASLHEELFADARTLTTRVRLTQVSEAGGMIIQNFEFQVWRRGGLVYDGTTSFGFFSAAALAQQIGIRDAAERTYTPHDDERARAATIEMADQPPWTPQESAQCPVPSAQWGLPGRAYRMIDRVEILVQDGGPAGLGFARGSARVDPDAWFFKAHFFQDPVWPGSLGLESFLQVLKAMMIERSAVRGQRNAELRFESIAVGIPHTWRYRGQIIPTNRRVEVDAVVTRAEEGAAPLLVGDGFLRVDGVNIYEMTGFGVRGRRA